MVILCSFLPGGLFYRLKDLVLLGRGDSILNMFRHSIVLVRVGKIHMPR